MKKLSFVTIAAAVMLATISCQKEETPVSMTADQINDEIVVENLFVELDGLADEGVEWQLSPLKSGGVIGNYLNDDCPVITYDKESKPRKIVMDFGTGCVGKDGKTRSGKIIITSTAFENLMVERVKRFENFVVDGKNVEGKITTKVTINRELFSRLAIITEDLKVTLEDNTTFMRKGILTREHLLGKLGNPADDETTTWGEVVTKRANGATITKTIDKATPLLFKMECKQIVSGIAAFSNGEASWTIDYGSGECDNTATVTRNGETRTVKLRK